MAVINTPGAILSMADALEGDFERVAADIARSSVSPSFKASWISFAEEWGAFYSGLQGVGGWVDRLWGSTIEQIDSYRTQLRSWQERFTAEGGRASGPVVAPPSVNVNPFAGSLNEIKWILLAAAVLGAVIIYGKARS